MLTIRDALSGLVNIDVISRSASLDMPFIGVSIDSREIEAGQVFFAVKGKKLNGHSFVVPALAAGASLAIVEKDYQLSDSTNLIRVDDPLTTLHELAQSIRFRHNPLTIAVTGSVGKTTTKNQIGELFSVIAPTIFSKGSFNNEFGVPLTLLQLSEKNKYACIEIGINTPGEMARLASIARPDIAVITNIGTAHIGRFGSEAAILAEKAKLLDFLQPTGVAVLNSDDKHLITLRDRLKRDHIRTIWFGNSPEADIQLVSKELTERGLRLTLRLPDTTLTFMVSPPDAGTMYARIAAIAVAHAAGIRTAVIAESQLSITPESRIRISKANGLTIIDDTYNSSLASVLNGINLLAEYCDSPFIVLGDLREVGDYLLDSYTAILRAAQAIEARVITVGETRQTWLEAAVASGFHSERLMCMQKWQDAVSALLSNDLPSRSAVFIKGARFSHLERIALYLEGKASTCGKVTCDKYIHCSVCPEFT